MPPEMLDYSVEELQAFAKKHLRKAYEIDTRTGWLEREVSGLGLAIAAATHLSSQAFDRFDSYMEGTVGEEQTKERFHG